MRNHSEPGFVLGVLGGMGPLASAEFLKTIYESSIRGREQLSPKVILYSDPSVPDRTESFLEGQYDSVLEPIEEALNNLVELGASKIVICCVTSHMLMRRLPSHLREKIISLPDIIFDALQESETKHLLLCSLGSRKSRVFENHPRWEEMKESIVLPSDVDQSRIHYEIIYQIKRNRPVQELVPLVRTILRSYGVQSFIAGCTELHLLAKHEGSNADGSEQLKCIDPLGIIAASASQNGLWHSNQSDEAVVLA
jgi:aspartate racemase